MLIVRESQGVPGDRRVMAEARTLQDAGWDVTVVCPVVGSEGQPDHEVIEGADVHRFPLRQASGAVGYVREYAQALHRIRRLVAQLDRERPFDVVHVANPPDFLNLAAQRPLSRGARLVFDHRDLTPELFRTRFGRGGALHRILLGLERQAVRSADVVLSTNDSYRRLAIVRGGARSSDVFVVRNGPDLRRFKPVDPEPSLRRGRRFLLAYVGVMGPQDGIDHLIEALAELRARRGDDWHAALIGDGEVLEAMRELAAARGIEHLVEFTGWRGERDVRRWVSTADVCLAPDPPGPLNNLSTMAKVPEYMALGKPIASYDLPETRVSAGPAAAYAIAPVPGALADCVHELLEDQPRRARMGSVGLERIGSLSWEHSAERLLGAYEHLSRKPAGEAGPQPAHVLR